MTRAVKALTIAGLAVLASTPPAMPAHAEEGMWLPDQTGKLGGWLRRNQLDFETASLGTPNSYPLNAIVSLGGCSAAFVSDQGLVVTNHHCVYGAIQYNSRPDRDYLRDGFLAHSLAEEMPAAPGTRIFILESDTDVTSAMNRGVTTRSSGLARFERMEANRAALIARCESQPGRRCEVKSYFGGSSFRLQRQLAVQDVRLVYAPAGGIGNFGGEADNWMWPRHTGDFGFFRAYVAPDGSSAPYSRHNVPYRPPSWLRMSRTGVKDGDPIMVAGVPGATQRLATAEEARFAFGTLNPLRRDMAARHVAQIEEATRDDRAATIAYAASLRGQQNIIKKLAGQMAGAERINLLDRKIGEERAYRAWIAEDPDRRRRYGRAAQSLDSLVAESQHADMADLTLSLLDRSQLLAAARTLFRWAKEREKPDKLRSNGYRNRDRQSVADRLERIDRRFSPVVDRSLFEAAMRQYRAAPEHDRAFVEQLDAIGFDRLYGLSRLSDPEERRAWMNRPASAFEASDDPFIRLAITLHPTSETREQARKDLDGRMQAARSVYLQGMRVFADERGYRLYPDANGSLRLTFGRVTGKAVDGQTWHPFTTAEGLLAKHTGRGDFAVPPPVVAAIKAKNYGRYIAADLQTLPVDFLSTVDITNGNSGSATLDGKGELVGLAFDGTMEGIISDWAFDPKVNRTIHVDSRFMLWVMQYIDHADRLLLEIGMAE